MTCTAPTTVSEPVRELARRIGFGIRGALDALRDGIDRRGEEIARRKREDAVLRRMGVTREDIGRTLHEAW
jgi:hypothetical protein